jgi:hypothetical protein
MSQGHAGCFAAASVPVGIIVLALLWNFGNYLDPPKDPTASFTGRIAACFDDREPRGAAEALGRTMKQGAVGITGLGVVLLIGIFGLVSFVTSKSGGSNGGGYSE